MGQHMGQHNDHSPYGADDGADDDDAYYDDDAEWTDDADGEQQQPSRRRRTVQFDDRIQYDEPERERWDYDRPGNRQLVGEESEGYFPGGSTEDGRGSGYGEAFEWAGGEGAYQHDGGSSEEEREAVL